MEKYVIYIKILQKKQMNSETYKLGCSPFLGYFPINIYLSNNLTYLG